MAATSVGSLGNPYRWREVLDEEGLPVPPGEQFALPVSFWNRAFGARSKSSRSDRQDHCYRLVFPAPRAIAFPWGGNGGRGPRLPQLYQRKGGGPRAQAQVSWLRRQLRTGEDGGLLPTPEDRP